MLREIFKKIKAVFSCKNCCKKTTKRIIVEGLTDVSVKEITPQIEVHTPLICKKCGYNSFQITYAFYHEEKVKTTNQLNQFINENL